MSAFSGGFYEVVNRRALPKVDMGNNAHLREGF
jgi:hypothetical protein